ncbi:peptidyl-alpha-hydroxyglycine alpha-amidating lyase family protein [Fulvivirgaceae bacterium BMA10]|uniref:Peptidyl-alpha-hydroxyglycine alpha-amidating lyase family protein n=1 Tax=Splendidivirga corallicola TaxID=3051826 RepID=A0ABT8KZZ4_9BACT|nr:peptidyl-alpha-hydroxyglycine alpha-amidating lyase family protein [Fulvivirgaceae bacterium BMA10]
MKYKYVGIFYFLIGLPFFGCENSQKKETDETKKTDAYELVKDWPKLPEDLILSKPVGLGIDSENNIIVFHRAGRVLQDPLPEDKIQENTILMLDKQTGEVIKSWGADLFIMPHGLEVDHENNVWATDLLLHQVFKFSPDGELLLSLGESGIPGIDSTHFDRPTDVAVSDDGSFYVSDGYGNNRIVKFSRNGTYLLEWGVAGNKEGEFNVPHGIDLDEMNNVYIADRENNRIQKFDAMGNYIGQWGNDSSSEQLFSIVIDKKRKYLFGIDYTAGNDTITQGSDILRFDLNFNLDVRFGRSGFSNAPVSLYHDILVDDEGNIYTGDLLGDQVHKFQLKKPDNQAPD